MMKRSSLGLLLVPAVSLAFVACTGKSSTEDIQATASQYYTIAKSAATADAQPYQGNLVVAAKQYVLARGNDLRLSDHTGFTLKNVGRSQSGMEHVRLDQTHRGFRVFGKQVIVHAQNGVIESTTGHVLGGLDDFDAPTVFDDTSAMNLAKADYASKTSGAQLLEYKRETIEQVVYVKDRQPYMAWHVHFFTEPQAGVDAGRWNYFIDVRDGQILDAFNWLTTVPDQGSGPGGNPNISRIWNMELDVLPSGGNHMMDTRTDPDVNLPTVHSMHTLDFNNTTNNGQTVTGPLASVGDATENDAHGFTELTLEMMYQWYGYDSIEDLVPYQVSPNDGYSLRSRVHYSSSTDNAFWDGTQMTYYDGGTYFYDLTGDIDVVSHEIAHGFTERHSNLIYSQESGGLNESFSDIAGTLAEFFHEGDTINPIIPPGANWDVGTDVTQPGGLPWPGNALRFMCNPPQDTNSIDNYNQYNDGMDVHYSSGISNKAFCLASARLSDTSGNYDPNTTPTVAGVQKAGLAWYEANSFYWGPSTTFYDACDWLGFVAFNITDDMGNPIFSAGEVQALLDSWLDVGVACDGILDPLVCDAVFTTDSGVVTSPNWPNNYPDNVSRVDCIQPNSGNEVLLQFTDFNTEAGYDFVSILDGNTRLVLVGNTSGTASPPDTQGDYLAINFTSDQFVNAPGWRAVWNVVVIGDPPVADFTYTAAKTDAAFTDLSSDTDGVIVAWDWDFGDGNSDTVQNPNHSYAAGGTYDVTLTVTDDAGNLVSTTKPVVVVDNVPPVADFIFTSTDRDFAFTDLSSDSDGTIVAWDWDFGDGSTDTVQNPNYSYATSGAFTVTLTVTDDNGDTATASQVVEPNEGPAVSFTFATMDLRVDFTDASTDSDGSLVSWSWDFGDGNTSVVRNPTHTYGAAGTYDVILTVTDDQGDFASATQSVTVMFNVQPTADFSYASSNLAVTFTDLSADADGQIVNWNWDFGDGNTSTLQGPSNTYATPGTYSVTLTVTDDAGGTASRTRSVTVEENDGGGGGCCDTNGQKEPPWSALIVLVGLVLMRRRRRATAIV